MLGITTVECFELIFCANNLQSHNYKCFSVPPFASQVNDFPLLFCGICLYRPYVIDNIRTNFIMLYRRALKGLSCRERHSRIKMSKFLLFLVLPTNFYCCLQVFKFAIHFGLTEEGQALLSFHIRITQY